MSIFDVDYEPIERIRTTLGRTIFGDAEIRLLRFEDLVSDRLVYEVEAYVAAGSPISKTVTMTAGFDRYESWRSAFLDEVIRPAVEKPSTPIGRRIERAVRRRIRTVRENVVRYRTIEVPTRICPHLRLADDRTHVAFLVGRD